MVSRNIAAQREWYGEPLGDRVRRLVVAFDVSQAHLADVLGVSPPMLSQLMSGRRAKIGNPAVLARLVMLERRVLTPGVAAGDREALRQALAEVRASRPTVTHNSIPVVSIPPEDQTLSLLRDLVPQEELAAAVEQLDGQVVPELSRLLRRAAGLTGTG